MYNIMRDKEEQVVGILFAQRCEVQDFLNSKSSELEVLKNLPFKTWRLKRKNITFIFIRSGIGKAVAAAATQFIIDKFNVRLIFNIGVVGALSRNINVKDLFIIEKTKYLDVDMQVFGYPHGQQAKTPLEYYRSSPRLLKTLERIFKFPKAIALTSDSFVLETNTFLAQNLPLIEEANVIVDMEIGVIGQIAYQNFVDFCAIKIISDKIYRSESEEAQQENQYYNSLAGCSLILERVLDQFLEAFDEEALVLKFAREYLAKLESKQEETSQNSGCSKESQTQE